MKKAEKEYIKTMASNASNAIILVSKGRAWIDIEKDSVRFTGIDEEDIKHAGTIQLMFDKSLRKNIKKVQKALDYFNWKIYLTEENDAIVFRGEDRFLLVQIANYFSNIPSKEYAEMYRKAIEDGEKVYI